MVAVQGLWGQEGKPEGTLAPSHPLGLLGCLPLQGLW